MQLSNVVKIFMKSQPSTDFEIQGYYWHKSKLNGVYSRTNLPNIVKDGTCAEKYW